MYFKILQIKQTVKSFSEKHEHKNKLYHRYGESEKQKFSKIYFTTFLRLKKY